MLWEAGEDRVLWGQWEGVQLSLGSGRAAINIQARLGRINVRGRILEAGENQANERIRSRDYGRELECSRIRDGR